MSHDAELRAQLDLIGLRWDDSRRYRGERPDRVELRDGWVQWDYDLDAGPADEARFGGPVIAFPESIDARIAFGDFVALAGASDEDVAAFVRRWGPLNLCRHGMPLTHAVLGWHDQLRRDQYCANVPGDGVLHGRDSASEVRRWAAMARALVTLSTALHVGLGLGDAATWKVLDMARPHTVRQARERVERQLNLWLVLADARPSVTLGEKALYGFTALGVFGVLALELVRSVVRAHLAVCAACGRAFELRQPPRANENAYCQRPECKSHAGRQASKAARRRKRLLSAEKADDA